MKSLVLIGFFSAGKSNVGKSASALFNLPFVDTDAEIEKRFPHKKIGEIHRELGEDGFRCCERTILSQLSKERCLIATGGGIVVAEESRRLLKQMGTLIYLRARWETLLERIQKKGFPSYAEGKRGVEIMSSYAAQRFPLYEALADEIIDTDQATMEEVVQKIGVMYGQ